MNIFYLTKKDFTAEERRLITLMLYQHFLIIYIDEQMMMDTLGWGLFRDLEDDLQIRCAEGAGVDYIITRDPKGFKTSNVPSLSPEEFLQMLDN